MDQSDWEPHRTEIHRIYIEEDKTLEELRQLMIRNRGFHKSKNQYQTKLKKWGFRKYRMGAEKWKYVKRQIDKRQKLKKASEVFIDGVPCPPNIVQAEIRRQAFETAREIYDTAPTTPYGIVVCTPVPAPSPRAPNGDRDRTPGPSTPQIWPPNLPWFTFSQTALRSIALSPLGGDDGLLRLVKIYISKRLSFLLPNKTADCIPAAQSSSLMAAALSSVMPEEYAGQHAYLSDCLCGISDEADFAGVIRVAIFLMSNDLSGGAIDRPENDIHDEDDMVMAIFYLSRLYTLQNTRCLLSTPGATAHAISTKFWASAVRTNDLEAVDVLLKAGTNPDTRVLSYYADKFRPLIIAALSRYHTVALEMSRLLFSYNTCSKDPQALESALYHATRAGNTMLMELLLWRGAYVSGRSLEAAISLEIPDLLEILLAADSRVNKRCNDDEDYSILGIAVKRNDVPLTRRLLASGAEVDAHQEIYLPGHGYARFQSTTLGLAVIAANGVLIDLLLTAGADVNHKTHEHNYLPPLVLAVKNGHTKFTERLLQAGADVALGDATGGSTLVQQALASDNEELSRVLRANGASFEEKFIQDHYSSMLMRKVKENDLESVIHLIGRGARVNDTHEGIPDTVLGAAVCQGNHEILRIILRAGAVNNTGQKLVSIGNVETARCLEQHGMLSDILRLSGQSVLSNAIRSNDNDLVQFLLDRRVDQPSENVRHHMVQFIDSPPGMSKFFQSLCYKGHYPAFNISNSPLAQATYKGNLWLAKTLVKRGALITDSEIFEAIRWCCASRVFVFLDLFLDALGGRTCAAPNSYAAAMLGHIPPFDINRLVDAGLDPRGEVMIPPPIDIDIPGIMPSSMSVLDMAVNLNKKELFRLLLGFGKWDSQTKGQALTTCISRQCKDLVQELLDAGADVNHQVQIGKNYVTPLACAVQTQDIPIIHSLLSAGANIDWAPPESWYDEVLSLFQRAVRTGNKAIVEILIQEGVDVNGPALGHYGKSALQCAAYDGNTELVDILLKAGANVNQAPAKNYEATALQLASMQGYIGIARRLLKKGAEVDAPGAWYHGRTALEGAAEFGSIDMLQLLLNEGASVHGAGRRQYIRAIKLAEGHLQYAAAKLLRDFGGWNADDARQMEREVLDPIF